MKTKTHPPQIISVVASDTPFESEEDLLNRAHSDHNSKRIQFKGEVLANYNRTYKELGIVASKPNDSNAFFFFLILYAMLRGEEIYQASLAETKSVEAAEDAVDLKLPIEIEDNIEAFRAGVRKWSRHFNDKDADTASKLLIGLIKQAERNEIVGSGGDSGGTDRAGK